MDKKELAEYQAFKKQKELEEKQRIEKKKKTMGNVIFVALTILMLGGVITAFLNFMHIASSIVVVLLYLIVIKERFH